MMKRFGLCFRERMIQRDRFRGVRFSWKVDNVI